MFEFNYVIEVITGTIFNTNFLKFISLHFYIVSASILFFVLTYVWHNDRENNSDYKQ